MLPSGTAVPLWLDHASVAVPRLREAVATLDARLGLRTTLSPADPERHGRVHLDRAYLEVAAGRHDRGWTAPGFFLRFADPAALRQHLDSTGLPYRFGEYQGVDGRWDDVEIDPGSVAFPILVRRTDPPEIARHWPPPLSEAHRCGARTLEAVLVSVPDLDAAVAVYAQLVGVAAVRASDRDGARRAEIMLASGRVVLVEGDAPGIAGIVLGVGSLPQAMAEVGPLTGRPVAWLNPTLTGGVRFGFVGQADTIDRMTPEALR